MGEDFEDGGYLPTSLPFKLGSRTSKAYKLSGPLPLPRRRMKARLHKHDTWVAVPAPQKDMFRSSSKLVLIGKHLACRRSRGPGPGSLSYIFLTLRTFSSVLLCMPTCRPPAVSCQLRSILLSVL